MLNRLITARYEYMKAFNSVQTIDSYLIELLVLCRKSGNYLSACQEMNYKSSFKIYSDLQTIS